MSQIIQSSVLTCKRLCRPVSDRMNSHWQLYHRHASHSFCMLICLFFRDPLDIPACLASQDQKENESDSMLSNVYKKMKFRMNYFKESTYNISILEYK